MIQLAHRMDLRRLSGHCLQCSPFEKHPYLFYGVLVLLVALFVVAAVHEIIPGLCNAVDDAGQTCPFCKLAHSVYLALAVLSCLLLFILYQTSFSLDAGLYAHDLQYPCFLLRAPPLG